ncbi:plasmid mobilization protein [Inquilinus sp.]|jgi:hypothetical protein|uniref:plasmid mobilization protein n=1 Tax=Inquilinus sp. TaxID=1932117 RepID=UPI0037849308
MCTSHPVGPVSALRFSIRSEGGGNQSASPAMRDRACPILVDGTTTGTSAVRHGTQADLERSSRRAIDIITQSLEGRMTNRSRTPGSGAADRRRWKSFRLSDEEMAALEARAQAAGVNVSELIRDELLDGTDPSAASTKRS